MRLLADYPMMINMNYQKIVQAAAYLAGKCGVGGLNRLHAYKLLYLADRDSLRKSGMTITGDNYDAMQYGPVGGVLPQSLFKRSTASGGQ